MRVNSCEEYCIIPLHTLCSRHCRACALVISVLLVGIAVASLELSCAADYLYWPRFTFEVSQTSFCLPVALPDGFLSIVPMARQNNKSKTLGRPKFVGEYYYLRSTTI